MKGYYKMPEETAMAIDATVFALRRWRHRTGRLSASRPHRTRSSAAARTSTRSRWRTSCSPCPAYGRQVVGIPDARLGEIVGAFIRTRPGYEDMTDDVREYAIPRTPTRCPSAFSSWTISP
ncbi:MAG: hypothetical protein ACLSGS_11085 [Adlercreutzia sp.]